MSRHRAAEQGTSILIVDDDKDSCDAARLVLEEEGYVVDVAPDGRAALAQLKTKPAPRVILVDLMMPVMDGAAFLAELEKSREIEQIAVVVMTASGPDPRLQGLRYPLLRKPFGVEELLDIVTRTARGERV
jgi:CheY-like chemotaxis protein